MRQFAGIVLASVMFFAADATAQEVSGRLTVVGTGEVQAVPDMALVTLGVEARGDTAREAMDDASKRIEAIFAVLEQAGVAREDVQTAALTLDPVYEDRRNDVNRPPRLEGFEARNTLRVTVRALDRLGSILDEVIDAGANAFRGLSFALQDPVIAQDDARREAVADALGKATLLAEAAGARRGPILLIEEAGAAPRPEYNSRFAMSEAMTVAVAPGSVTVTERVTIVFALEQ